MRVPAGCPLTAGELDVVNRLAGGVPSKQIAAELGCAQGTIRDRIQRALTRLGAQNRIHLVVLCWQSGWIEIDGLRHASMDMGVIIAAQRVFNHVFLRLHQNPSEQAQLEVDVLRSILERERGDLDSCIDCGAPIGPHAARRDAHEVSRDYAIDAPHQIGSVCTSCAGEKEPR